MDNLKNKFSRKELLGLPKQQLEEIANQLKIENSRSFEKDDLITEIKIAKFNNLISDSVSAFPFAPIIESTVPVKDMAKLWFREFEKNRVRTIIITVILTIGLAGGVYYLEIRDRLKIVQAQKENYQIKNRIDELDNMESSLRNLINFIELQRLDLVQTEEALKQLKVEKENLEPILKLKQEAIDALFLEQEKRLQRDRWLERLIGVGFGVIASLIASYIYGLWRRRELAKNIKEEGLDI